MLICVWAVMEPFRLYFGMKGNLKEAVPDAATYLLISVFPQTAIISYLGYFQPVMLPADYIVGTLMLMFLVSPPSCAVLCYALS